MYELTSLAPSPVDAVGWIDPDMIPYQPKQDLPPFV